MSSGAPRGWPLIGHFAAFRKDTSGFMMRMVRAQGDVARFRLGRRDAFILAHPRDIQAVLVDHASGFSKGRLLLRARRLLGDGLLTSEGQLHQTQRRRIQPVFTRERVRGYAAEVPALASRHMSRWRSGTRVVVDAEMDALTMTIVARALLGADIENDVPQLGSALRRLGRWAPLLILPGGRVLERTHLPFFGRLREALECIESVIEQRIAEGGTTAPLLGALLQAQDDGVPMPASLVRDQVMTMFLAGHETTAAALTWAWLLLSQHPEVETRLHEEVSAPDATAFPYTQTVIKEVLRLFPPVGRMGRRPIQDVALGNVLLTKGSTVFVSPFVTQRDPRWFAAPEEFRPDRWAEAAPERPRFAWFPFGAGPRSCIGEHFARSVMEQVIITIARQWRLRSTQRTLPRIRSLLTLKPQGTVWMVPEKRTT